MPPGLSSTPSRRRRLMADGLKFGLLLAALIGLSIRSAEGLGYYWQWYRIPPYFFSVSEGELLPGPLLQGLAVTLQIAAVSLVLAPAFGLISALMRLSGSFLARWAARAYIELIRNTPLLVQIFFIYFVLSPVFEISAFVSAVLALSLFEGAYASEIFRAGILSIHRNQWEAAFSLGLGTWRTYRLVILPQAIRHILPPLTGQAISLVKDSALVSTIAIYDLTMQAQAIISETYLVFEIWFTVAVVYLVMNLLLSVVVACMEKRLRVYR